MSNNYVLTRTRKYWVTMTDRFMSGWGMAKGKKNKLVIECDTARQADAIYAAAQQRPEMKYINESYKRPYYNPRTYYVSWKSAIDDMPMWLHKGGYDWAADGLDKPDYLKGLSHA